MRKTALYLEAEIRAAWGRVSCPARGVWLTFRDCAAMSKRPGHLLTWDSQPMSAEQLAQLCQLPASTAAPLIGELALVGLIRQSENGLMHSPALAELMELREEGRQRAGEWRDKRYIAQGERYVTQKSVTNRARIAHEVVTPSPPSSPLFSPPETPSLIPPSSTSPCSAAASQPRKRAKTEAVLSADQQRIRMEFSDWWTKEAWPKHHGGVVYDFEGVDAKLVLECLRSSYIAWDMPKLKAVAELYLVEPEIYGCHGHPLTLFRKRLGHYVGRYARKQKGQESYGRIKPNAEQRGEFSEPQRDIPDFEPTPAGPRGTAQG